MSDRLKTGQVWKRKDGEAALRITHEIDGQILIENAPQWLSWEPVDDYGRPGIRDGVVQHRITEERFVHKESLVKNFELRPSSCEIRINDDTQSMARYPAGIPSSLAPDDWVPTFTQATELTNQEPPDEESEMTEVTSTQSVQNSELGDSGGAM